MYQPDEATALLLKAFPPKKKKPTRTPEQEQDIDYSGEAPPDDEPTQFVNEPAPDDQDDDGLPDDGEDDGDDPDDGDLDGDDQDDAGDGEFPTDDDGDGEPDDADDLGYDGDEAAQGQDPLAGQGGLPQGGAVQGAVQQLAALERDYYAAKGMHGSGHHKTEALLEQYHKAVRQLVRATAGGQGAAPTPPDDSGDDQDPKAAQGGGQPPAKQPPFGKQPGQAAAGGAPKPPPKVGASPTPPASQPDEGSDDEDSSDEQPGKKKPPFGKSFAMGDLVKSLYAFEARGEPAPAALPDKLLPSYLAAFVDAAYSDMCNTGRYQGGLNVSDPDAAAGYVLNALVRTMPLNPNLMRAGGDATLEEIKAILEERKLLQPRQPTADEGNNDVQGVLAMGGAALFRSEQPAQPEMLKPLRWYEMGPDMAKSELGITLAPHTTVVFEDDQKDPFMHFHADRRRVLADAASVYADPIVKSNRSTACQLHGGSDWTAALQMKHPYVQCQCPK